MPGVLWNLPVEVRPRGNDQRSAVRDHKGSLGVADFELGIAKWKASHQARIKGTGDRSVLLISGPHHLRQSEVGIRMGRCEGGGQLS